MMPKEALEAFKFHFKAGWAGYPLVGTPEQIARELAKLSNMGLDGTLLNWPRYEEGLQRFVAEVLPLLEQMGIRKAVTKRTGIPA
jgi:alkanesulfonate monooxygenase SsuD/methylene tetrahydromethanopterin reductase-like flavin-dependent oxidoreductase (luciferase family)